MTMNDILAMRDIIRQIREFFEYRIGGDRGDRVIIDDPHNLKENRSDTESRNETPFPLSRESALILLAGIDRLQSVAGEVSGGPSFSDIRSVVQETASHTVKTTGC